MNPFLIIGLGLTMGLLLQRVKFIPKNAYQYINKYLIYIALPAVSFNFLPFITWSSKHLFPIIAPILVWIGAGIYAQWYHRKQPLASYDTAKGFRIATGLSNTSFLGFPLITAYFGERWLEIGVICDQITFLILATLGVAIASKTSTKDQRVPMWYTLRKVISFPPLIACVLALSLPKFIFEGSVHVLSSSIAKTLSPLALISIGMQLRIGEFKQYFKPILALLGYKLLIAPLLILLVAIVFGLHDTMTQVTIFEMSMACLVSAGIVAEQYHCDGKFTNLAIGISILISFITTGIWYFLIQWLIR